VSTLGGAVDDALAALASLRELGEEVADEWQYVTDLETTWAARLREPAATRGHEPLAEATAAAVARLIEEVAAIRDPHRAIDWLSTFPQAVLVALRESG
jgi:hypothetical protein